MIVVTDLLCLQAPRDVCLAAADDATRQCCVRVIQAASAGAASSSLHNIASAVALTAELFEIKSVPAVNAVLAALGKAEVDGLDLPLLKAAGFDATACTAAGHKLPSLKAVGFLISDLRAAGYDIRSLREAGFDVWSLIADFGCDVSRTEILVIPPPPPPPPPTAKCTARADNCSPKTSTLHPVTRGTPALPRQFLRDAAYAPS